MTAILLIFTYRIDDELSIFRFTVFILFKLLSDLGDLGVTSPCYNNVNGELLFE